MKKLILTILTCFFSSQVYSLTNSTYKDVQVRDYNFRVVIDDGNFVTWIDKKTGKVIRKRSFNFEKMASSMAIAAAGVGIWCFSNFVKQQHARDQRWIAENLARGQHPWPMPLGNFIARVQQWRNQNQPILNETVGTLALYGAAIAGMIAVYYLGKAMITKPSAHAIKIQNEWIEKLQKERESVNSDL